MARTDFLLDEDGDLKIVDGDFVTGDSDAQNVRLILIHTKGSFKQSPLLGVGLVAELNGLIDGSVERRIMLNLQADGYKVKSIKSNGELLNIDYEANNS